MKRHKETKKGKRRQGETKETTIDIERQKMHIDTKKRRKKT